MSAEQAPNSPVTAQCFCCKEVRDVKDGKIVKTENNRLRLSGVCSKCGKAVSKFIPNPDSPKVDKAASPSSPKKKIQKKPRKQTLKKCAQCACVAHQAILDDQPKKKRKVAAKKAVNDELAKRIEDLEKHLHMRQVIADELKAIDEEPKTPEIGLSSE